jgi:hypothetical protein
MCKALDLIPTTAKKKKKYFNIRDKLFVTEPIQKFLCWVAAIDNHPDKAKMSYELTGRMRH